MFKSFRRFITGDGPNASDRKSGVLYRLEATKKAKEEINNEAREIGKRINSDIAQNRDMKKIEILNQSREPLERTIRGYLGNLGDITPEQQQEFSDRFRKVTEQLQRSLKKVVIDLRESGSAQASINNLVELTKLRLTIEYTRGQNYERVNNFRREIDEVWYTLYEDEQDNLNIFYRDLKSTIDRKTDSRTMAGKLELLTKFHEEIIRRRQESSGSAENPVIASPVIEAGSDQGVQAEELARSDQEVQAGEPASLDLIISSVLPEQHMHPLDTMTDAAPLSDFVPETNWQAQLDEYREGSQSSNHLGAITGQFFPRLSLGGGRFFNQRRGTINDINTLGSDASAPGTTVQTFFTNLARRRATLHNIGPSTNQLGNNQEDVSSNISITASERERIQAFIGDDGSLQQDYGDDNSSRGEDNS